MSEYLTSCIADLGKTRNGDLALGIPNRPVPNDYTRKILRRFYCISEFCLASTDEDRQMMLVLPIDDLDVYKKRDRLIVKVVI